MKDFTKFVAKNKNLLFTFAKKNTAYNSKGQAVISKEDSWFNEDEWDEDFKEPVANERNLPAGRVVC